MSSIKRGRSIFILGLIISAIGAIVSVILPYLAKIEIDQLVSKQHFVASGTNLSPFLVFIAILVATLAVSFFDRFFRDTTQEFIREREAIFQHETDIFLYERISKMEMGLSLTSSFRNILRNVDQKLSEIVRTISSVPKNILGIIIRLGGITGVLVFFDWKILGIIAIGGILDYFIGEVRFKNVNRRDYDPELQSIDHTTWSIPHEIQNNLTELSRNGGIKDILGTFTKHIYRKQELLRPYQRRQILIESSTNFIDMLGTFAVKAVVGYTVFLGTESVGAVTMSVMYSTQLSSVISEIFQNYFDLKKIRFDLSFFEAFLDISTPAGSKARSNPVGSIKFQKVSFSYPNPYDLERPFYELLRETLKIEKFSGNTWRVKNLEQEIQNFEHSESQERKDNPVLSDFEFIFHPGRVYGIVGKNGAGKTTLINLISGFFRSYTGSIKIGGDDIKDWGTESFSDILSVISQVPYTYRAYGDSTVRTNLLLGVNRDVPDEELYKFLSDFGLKDKIQKSIHGLDSEIGKDIEFSGGQNQILSIIRVLLQDRPVIVLDEGTNQLDAENEALVMKHLMKNREGKIILFITHRMNTIARSDEVLCIEGGRIQAHGRPQDLLEANNNSYARFYRTQILHEEVLTA